MPAPRLLVTTPVHLRALLASTLELPPIAGIVSATAPLTTSLAIECERRWNAPLHEIYGSTETGEMAARRPAHESLWTLWPGVRLEASGDGHVAHGGHLPAPVLLQDCVEPVDASRFALHGRRTDPINVAGKRSSLGYLDHQLQSVDGVVEVDPDDGEVVGVVFLEDVIEELVGEVTDSSHGDRWTRRRV